MGELEELLLNLRITVIFTKKYECQNDNYFEIERLYNKMNCLPVARNITRLLTLCDCIELPLDELVLY